MQNRCVGLECAKDLAIQVCGELLSLFFLHKHFIDNVGVIYRKALPAGNGHNCKSRFIAKSFHNYVNEHFVQVDVDVFRGTAVVAGTLV